MANTVRLPYSNTATNTPSSLGNGVLAINQADGKIYYRNSSGVVTLLATGSGGGGTTEIYEYATTASFPGTGAAATLYLATDSRRLYSWTGSVYAEVGAVSSSPLDSRWDLFLPAAPTSVAGTPGNGQVSLTWTAPTVSAQTPITSYTVQYSTNSGSSWTTWGTAPTTNSATVTSLTNGTAYTWRVSATNGVGTSAYSTASSAVTPAIQDTYYSSVSLLLHMDGANNSTTFTDNSGTPKTVTAYADAKVSTAQSKFGGASAVFDGTGDYLGAASVGNIGTSDFVLEWWMRVADVSVYQHIIGTSTNGNFMVALLAPYNGAGAIGVGRNNVAWDFVRNATLSNNTWHHVAIARTSNTMYMYVDGSLVGSSGSNSNSYSIDTLQIGGHNAGSAAVLNGYLDDLRLTLHGRGYTGSTITVPTAAYPNS